MSTYFRTHKDQRRADLILPYASPAPSEDPFDPLSALTTTLPMAAMFTRHRLMGWSAVVVAVQSWLNEPAVRAEGSTKQPAVFGVLMAVMSLFVTYVPMFFPPPQKGAGAVPTAAATATAA